METAASSVVAGDPYEDDLVAELRAGVPDAFDRAVQEYGGRLLATARSVLRNEEDAREVVQDTFVSAFRNLHTFTGEARFVTWLRRIATNAAISRLRRRPTRERSIDELLPRFRDDGHQELPAVEWRATSDEVVSRDETRRLVREAIDELPDDFRAVLLLRDIEQNSTAEVALVLGVTNAVVKTRLHRARLALRTLLDRHHREGAL